MTNAQLPKTVRSSPVTRDTIRWIEEHWDEGLRGYASPFLAMGSLMRLHQTMVSAIDEALKPFELIRSGYLLLITLDLAEGGALKLGQLARDLLVHPTTVTLIIDKLEEQRLVERVPHPEDRRAIYANITPSGRALAREASKALEKIGYGLGAISDAEARRLVRTLAVARKASGDIA
jgi:DNA-binding MarR family transcriptional regulator